MTPDLSRLADPFPPADIEWKPGAVTRDKTKGLAMAYVTSRAVQDRLDEVCGPAGWRNEFRPGPDGGVLCGISIRITYDDGTQEWVTKWDGADNTDVEAVKGGLSGAMKRAAVQWGIGRYLYSLEPQWVRLDERGRFAEPPRLPAVDRPRAAAPPPPRTGRSAADPEAPAAEARSVRAENDGGARAGQRRIIRPAPSPGDGDARPAHPRR